MDLRFFIPAAGNLAGVMSIADCIRRATMSPTPYDGSELEQFQEKCEAVFRSELRQSKETERFAVSMKR
ncbi:hypothetical protein [Mesorhizobium sp. B2-7-1]|uniref:hypothetical protein n=1 Tax=Mesorhizobium sp. B2-7-1 TaxID=2589909 RepID=UPI0015E3EF57|nr:hypothetical protein [Mesorhizobium sp. B2-7-1]